MKNIPLRDIKKNITGYTLVDDNQFENLSTHNWCIDKDGYATRSVKVDCKLIKIYMHREILGLKLNQKQYTDHINRNRLDNRIKNLRIITKGQNGQNKSSRSNASSIYRGVSYIKETGRWRAICELNGKAIHIGMYDDEKEAGIAASDFRKLYMPYSNEDI